MLRRLDKMVGFTVEGTDGEVGKAKDFYFDDQEWMVRYLVVETGPWLAKKLALIAPACMGGPDWDAERFSVGLTKKQVEDSPDIDLHEPISRQQLESLDAHYGWPDYWAPGPRWVLAEGATVGMAPARQDVEPAYDYKNPGGAKRETE